MSRYRVSRSAAIKAQSTRVTRSSPTIASTTRGSPPRKYFRKVEVLEGGVGAGTRTRVEMCVLGTTRVFEQIVTEPEVGRVLLETDSDGLSSTTFTVNKERPPSRPA